MLYSIEKERLLFNHSEEEILEKTWIDVNNFEMWEYIDFTEEQAKDIWEV